LKFYVVAFANSTPIGLPAVLYIGVRDNGEIETPQRNLDEAQKRFNVQMQKVYPRIAYVTKIISENGLQALAVIVPGSEWRPHFAGLSYVREGSETKEASERLFEEMISQRSSKAAAILKWKGKPVSVLNRTGQSTIYFSETAWNEITRVVFSDQFYVTLQTNTDPPLSFPLSRVEINFDK
jgi:predicted HTH transcriptional regulator